MLLKKQKGEYGYLTAYRRQKLMITLILACMIAAVILGTIIIFGDTGRVMIVFAILLALPFSKFLIAWIVCSKFVPFDKKQYHDFTAKLDDNASLKDSLYYDVVVSQYEGMLFFQSICVRNGRIYALAFESKGSVTGKKYKRWIESCIKDAKEPYPVVIFDSVDAYIKKIKSISAPTDQTARMDKYIAQKVLDTCV